MDGKGSFFILLVIVAILTLTLAVMAGYLLFIASSPTTNVETVAAGSTIERPHESELASKKVFSEKQFFNLKSEGDKLSVIQVNVEMVYYKNVKGIRNIDEKLTFNEGKIKQIIGTYFQNMTIDEAKNPETKEKAANDLKKAINEYLCSNEKQKMEIIYEIIFDEWFYQ